MLRLPAMEAFIELRSQWVGFGCTAVSAEDTEVYLGRLQIALSRGKRRGRAPSPKPRKLLLATLLTALLVPSPLLYADGLCARERACLEALNCDLLVVDPAIFTP